MFWHFRESISEDVNDSLHYWCYGCFHRSLDERWYDGLECLDDHLEAVSIVLTQNGCAHKRKYGHNVVQDVAWEKLSGQRK